ncbi:MAG: hypothetical protein H0U73_03260 [Tatlockia sp.]|nr:hypothetical protein [Tatlockia sp.]
MLRKIGSSLIGAAVLVTTGWAADNNFQGLDLAWEMNVILPAKVGKTFHNFSFWKLTAECVMTTEDQSTELEVEGLNRNSSVDGQPIPKGKTMHLTIHPNQLLTVMAESGAQVKLTNDGPHTLNAHCTLISKE